MQIVELLIMQFSPASSCSGPIFSGLYHQTPLILPLQPESNVDACIKDIINVMVIATTTTMIIYLQLFTNPMSRKEISVSLCRLLTHAQEQITQCLDDWGSIAGTGNEFYFPPRPWGSLLPNAYQGHSRLYSG